MIVRKLGGAETSSTTTTSPGLHWAAQMMEYLLGPSYLGHLLILVVMVSLASKILCRDVFETFNAVRMERSKMDEQCRARPAVSRQGR
jgi:hypothetical protein